MWKKFTFKVVVFTGLVVLSIGAFNWVVDPFDIFGSPKIEGFNANKPETDTHVRTYKAIKLSKLKPKIILLGTSRTRQGINPENQNFTTKSVYNCGVGVGLPTEYEYFFNMAIKNNLHHTVIGVDLFTFYKKQLVENDFDKDVFGDFKLTKYIFSVDALKSSIKTIQQKDKSPYLTLGMNNQKVLEANYDKKAKAPGRHFLDNEKGYFAGFYGRDFSKAQTAHWKAFERILDKAHKNNIKITLFISPSHARQWEVLAITQGWRMFEEYRKRLIAVNVKVALENNKQPFALWDFAGYHPLTTEEVPNNPKVKMNWYWDSSHYKKELGDIVLDRMFDGNFSGGQNYQDFGVKLTKKNIEFHLTKLRAEREIWRKAHPQDVAEIEALKAH